MATDTDMIDEDKLLQENEGDMVAVKLESDHEEEEEEDDQKKTGDKVFTLWFEPRRSIAALGILRKLAQLKLAGEDYRMECPKALASMIATEKIKLKYPDGKYGNKNKNLYVHDIPKDTTEEVLRGMFPNVASVQLPVDSEGEKMGIAILDYKSGKDANSDLAQNSQVLIGDATCEVSTYFPAPEEVVRGPIRLTLVLIRDLSNHDLQQILHRCSKAVLQIERRKGVMTLWFEPRHSNPAIGILRKLAQLKLAGDEYTMECPKALASMIATEKIKLKYPDGKYGNKNRNLYVHDIPKDTTEEVLRGMFPNVACVQLPVDSDGEKMGVAILDYKSGKDANADLAQNPQVLIGDSTCEVSAYFPAPEEGGGSKSSDEGCFKCGSKVHYARECEIWQRLNKRK
ncbi:hypothetical protein FSP39_023078 [Pinctada imbricata]|uniref:CCHC-type domain-containing protein n=1 Tax=Pinctada imbricata TaxID=66713 RepID=A0AA89BUY7_PINIB|nr:hypothetical protein FSP39_023078 [Pinctada imbricata]